MIEKGTGPPVVMIPGIQGRWEWMAPAVDALSVRHHVFSFSLETIPHRSVFDAADARIDAFLDRSPQPRAAIIGVSFGGLIAARFAAREPARVSSLVLVSAPSPRWRVDPRTERYLRRPVRSLPLFVARSAGRLVPDVMRPLDRWTDRARFLARHLARVVRFPASPTGMAGRVGDWRAEDIAAECAGITAPTLLITGEADLDRVVPQRSTLEYLDLIKGARHVVLPRTGHIGLVSRPAEFAQLVEEFIDAPEFVRPGRSS
jgi:pimeloyl-ACP methyl ester carboxylesterase